MTSCIDMSGGSWSSTKFQSIRSRYVAVTWNLNPGTSFMILGGLYSGGTTDIVHTNGTVEPGFNLKYDSEYVVNFQIIIYFTIVYFRYACGIEDGDSFYITGGRSGGYSTNRVTRYYRNGSYEDMPTLNAARRYHACGSYMNNNMEKVL